MPTIEAVLAKLSTEGGCIVSSADCHEAEIIDAQARGDFYVTTDGCGYVRRLPGWLKKHCRHARGSEVARDG